MTNGYNDEYEHRQRSLFENEDLDSIINIDNTQDSNRMKHSMKKSQYDRIVRKKKMLFRQIRQLLRLLLIAAVVYFMYRLMTAARWYLPKDTITSYKIKRIQIIGNRITPTNKIIEVISTIELPNKPIYMIKTDEFVEKISGLQPVKKVYVKRLWSPARIIIFVEEKEPILTIAPSKDVEPIAFFTREGTLVGHQYMPLPSGYTPYKIITYGNNDDYVKWNKNKVLTYEKLAMTIENLTGEKVEYFDMQKPNDVYVKLQTANIRLGEINNKTFKRIKDIKSILAETKSFKSDIPVQYIDLSWEESKFIKLGENKDVEQDSNSSD